MKTIAVLPGDGIGVEVVEAVLPIVERMGLPLEFRFGEVGWQPWCRDGDPVPPATWKLLAESDTCLLGAVTSKPLREADAELAEHLRGTGLRYVSPVVQLRQRLALYANVRPVIDLAADRFRFAVIRENTEGLYSGLDMRGVCGDLWELVRRHPNAAESGPEHTSATIRLQTQVGMDRLLRFGFRYARDNGYDRLTVADKPNVLRESGHHLRERLELIGTDFPDIEPEILNVDALALWMVRRPERFGVVVAENMFGDILSDLGAGVMGGLGVAPSGNIGEHGSYFEPVHGSAPGMAAGRANPMALYLTVAMLLEQLAMPAPAGQIRSAVHSVVRTGRNVTYDLGGDRTTTRAAAAVEAAMGAAPRRQASVVTVGDELCNGSVGDTNGPRISALLSAAGYHVRLRQTVDDAVPDIRDAVRSALGAVDVLVVTGGLGPTSDDVTRDAVAAACGLALTHDEAAWHGLGRRVCSVELPVATENRRPALFPEGSTVLPNHNGTPTGARLEVGGTTVLMLPGPPRECLPMASRAIDDLPAGQRSASRSWRLLGVVEGEIASKVDALLARARGRCRATYRRRYPYVDVTVTCPNHAIPTDDLDRLLGPHTVSRSGLDAFAELSALGPMEMSVVDLSFAGEDTVAQLASAGVDYGGHSVGKPVDRPVVELHGGAGWNGGSRSHFIGSVLLTSRVTVNGADHVFRMTVPNRGVEVVDCAAAFYAWNVIRALRGYDRPDDDIIAAS